MNIAHVDLFFQLPDGFKGGFDEVLEEVLKHRAASGKEPDKSDYAKEFDENNSISKSGYDKIMVNKLRHEGKNLIGTISLIQEM